MAEEQNTAAFELVVGSSTFTQAEGGGLQSLVFEDHVDMVSMVRAAFAVESDGSGWGFTIGDEVTLALGSGTTAVFTGEVVAMQVNADTNGTTHVVVRCLDGLHKLARGRTSRSWTDATDSSVVEELAEEAGSTAESWDIEATTATHDFIMQRNESNAAICKRLAARNSYLLRVVDGVLHFKPPDYDSANATELGWGTNVKAISCTYDSTDQVQEVVVRGWSPADKDEVVGTATDGEDGDIESIGSGDTGPTVAGAFGSFTGYIADVPVTDQDVADEIAAAELNRLARMFGRGTVRVACNAGTLAGTMVNVSGCPGPVNGNWYVLGSRHSMGPKGTQDTELTVCRNTLGEDP